MGLLSNFIFHWDEQDLSRLVKSKRNKLATKNLYIKSDVDILKQLSHYELALHFRRKTRGVTETTQLINQLIETFSGERGRDTLGVPLINVSRMATIWERPIFMILMGFRCTPGLAVPRKGELNCPTLGVFEGLHHLNASTCT